MKRLLILLAFSAFPFAHLQAQAGSPATDPDGWLLAFLDVETTGLVPGYHEMIDLGLVMTDLDGGPIDSLFLRIQPEHPERLSEGAREVNAFDAENWRRLGALTPAAAIDSLARFHQRVAGDRFQQLVRRRVPGPPVPLAGFELADTVPLLRAGCPVDGLGHGLPRPHGRRAGEKVESR